MLLFFGDEMVLPGARFQASYERFGPGFGEIPISELKAFVDAQRDKLSVQPSDIPDEFEGDLSRIGFELFLRGKQDIKTVIVRPGVAR